MVLLLFAIINFGLMNVVTQPAVVGIRACTIGAVMLNIIKYRFAAVFAIACVLKKAPTTGLLEELVAFVSVEAVSEFELSI